MIQMLRILFLFTVMLLHSCGGAEQGSSQDDDKAANSRATNEKLNAYIAVSNYMISEYKGSGFRRSVEKFTEIYGSKQQPNLRQKDPQTWLGNNYNWGIQMAVDPALEIVDKAPAMEGLDELQKALCLQIKKTNGQLDAFLSYYKQKEFLNDDYKAAEAMHAQLMDEIARTVSMHQTANKAMDSWIAKRDEQDLIAMKEDQKIHYHLKYSLMLAEKIMDELRLQQISNANIVSFQTGGAEAHLKKLKESAAELSRLIVDEKELSKSGINTMSPLKRFGSEADEFIGHANLLFSKVKKKEAFTESDLKYMSQTSAIGKPYARDGSVHALFNSINEMIDAYNYIN